VESVPGPQGGVDGPVKALPVRLHLTFWLADRVRDCLGISDRAAGVMKIGFDGGAGGGVGTGVAQDEADWAHAGGCAIWPVAGARKTCGLV